MEEVKIWEEEVVIPTYEIGEPDKTRCFWKRESIRAAVERCILIRR